MNRIHPLSCPGRRASIQWQGLLQPGLQLQVSNIRNPNGYPPSRVRKEGAHEAGILGCGQGQLERSGLKRLKASSHENKIVRINNRIREIVPLAGHVD
ncbi:hypothetical protein [Legionella taurinensis]|uniref:Uncharacterized protein n=1 Tax=Legionella taurinensis TaxID=70611 RepID=A0A3A5L7E4_9GAMM|nr:hypothetical protein [Legionella taurinensis]RJT49232.1 hypothetical protein D6J04_00840 [Legionella taurinensis]RJT67492.1 hypothetical protein D6J03_07800 [Legionella taurinensis]